tara:strand:+ start:262 stop:483 length:222 start_codon:yes stop_codon:yes gene_type:complete
LDFITASCDQAGLNRLEVVSIHGALWIQTHFPKAEWDVLLNGQACFGVDCLTQLLEDAVSAGLKVHLPISVQS